MNVSRLVGVAGLFVTVTLAAPRSVEAETAAPSLPGYRSLGEIVLDKTGCSSCPVVINTDKRHRNFALASDTPFPIVLVGRVDVTCANGSTYQMFLQSPRRSGPFQVVPNTCVNLESKEITVTITSVSLSPADAERKVSIIPYGSFG